MRIYNIKIKQIIQLNINFQTYKKRNEQSNKTSYITTKQISIKVTTIIFIIGAEINN